MKVIITGGTGLIGRELSKLLTSDEHEVIVLSRNPSKSKGMPAGVQLVQWDAKSADGWGEMANGADAIINLAGASLADGIWTSSRKELISNSRVDAGKAVVEAVSAADTKPTVVIQSSAVGYYGANRGNELITEATGPGTDFLAQLCFDWELSTAPLDQMGVRRPILRTGVVLSQQGGAWPRLKLPFNLFAGGPLGNGEQYYPWIHIDDEVRAIYHLLLDNSANGPFNLTAPEPAKNKELAKTIGEVMGRPSFVPAPRFALRTVLGEMSTVVLDGQNAIPQKLQESGFTYLFPTLEEAVRNLIHGDSAKTPEEIQEAV